MQLINIDKTRYRKHLNIVIIGFIISLLSFSLIFGSLFIAHFSSDNSVILLQADSVQTSRDEESTPALEPQEHNSNFKYNFLGVVLALLTCTGILNRLKSSEFFFEIYYVWQLKKVQNLIYRKLKKIKQAVNEHDVNAMIILYFYYESQKQVYLLDDNTLTISSVEQALSALQEKISMQNHEISFTQFEKELLASYS